MNKLNNLVKKIKLYDKKNYLTLDKCIDENAFLDRLAFSLKNGVDIIEFDPTPFQTQKAINLSKKIKQLCDVFDTTFIIRERLDIAFTIAADGVILTTTSFTPEQAREILGENALIGILCNSIEDFNIAISTTADFIKTLNFVKPTIETSKIIF